MAIFIGIIISVLMIIWNRNINGLTFIPFIIGVIVECIISDIKKRKKEKRAFNEWLKEN